MRTANELARRRQDAGISRVWVHGTRAKRTRALTTNERNDGDGRRARTAVTLPLTTLPTATIAYNVYVSRAAGSVTRSLFAPRVLQRSRENTVGGDERSPERTVGRHTHTRVPSWRRSPVSNAWHTRWYKDENKNNNSNSNNIRTIRNYNITQHPCPSDNNNNNHNRNNNSCSTCRRNYI